MNSDTAQSNFSLPREPNMHSLPWTARGTPMKFQGTNKPLHAWLHITNCSIKVNRCDKYEKHPANLRERPHGQSRESAKHHKPCERHGGARNTAQGVNKLQIKKRNISHKVNRDCKSTSQTECTYKQPFLRIKKLEWLQQKNCKESRKDCIVIGTSMTSQHEKVLTRARKLSGIQ